MTSTTDPTLLLPSIRRSRHHLSWPLVRHGVAMALAMFAGMLVLGGARALVGLDLGFDEHPGGSYSLMATDMAIGMAAWMRFRGHAWVPTLQMCAAMYVPVVLLPLVWAGAMSSTAFMVLAHVLMVIAMIVLLWRHHTRIHRVQSQAGPSLGGP